MKALGEWGLGLFGLLKKLRSDFTTHEDNTTNAHSATSNPVTSSLMARNSSGISSVQEPTSAQHIATKNYVDTKVLASGSGTVKLVNTGVGLTGGPIDVSGTVYLDSVTPSDPGTFFTLATIKVDAYGRVLSAANGVAVTTVNVSSPVTKTGPAASPTIGIQASSNSTNGYMTSGQALVVYNSQKHGQLYRTSSYNFQIPDIGTGNKVKVTFTSNATQNYGIIGDTGNNRITNTSGGTVTANVRYHLSAKPNIGTNIPTAIIVKNNSTYYWQSESIVFSTTSGGEDHYAGASGEAIITLAPSDYVELYMYTTLLSGAHTVYIYRASLMLQGLY